MEDFRADKNFSLGRNNSCWHFWKLSQTVVNSLVYNDTCEMCWPAFSKNGTKRDMCSRSVSACVCVCVFVCVCPVAFSAPNKMLSKMKRRTQQTALTLFFMGISRSWISGWGTIFHPLCFYLIFLTANYKSLVRNTQGPSRSGQKLDGGRRGERWGFGKYGNVAVPTYWRWEIILSALVFYL